MAEYFVFYKSFAKATKRMTAEQKAELLDALIAKGIDEEDVDPDDIQDDAVAMAMELIIPQIDANERRRTNGSKGGRPSKTDGFEEEKPLVSETENHWLQEDETTGYAPEKPNIKDKDKDKDKDKEKDKEKDKVKDKEKVNKPTRAFTPPTADEVAAYCAERSNGINAQEFIDYYEQTGWKLSNGQRMVDWKAAIRNWENRRKNDQQERRQAQPTKTNPFTDYTHQTTYDWDAIEAYETANPVLKNYAGS